MMTLRQFSGEIATVPTATAWLIGNPQYPPQKRIDGDR
jgi:hypothetical protein